MQLVLLIKQTGYATVLEPHAEGSTAEEQQRQNIEKYDVHRQAAVLHAKAADDAVAADLEVELNAIQCRNDRLPIKFTGNQSFKRVSEDGEVGQPRHGLQSQGGESLNTGPKHFHLVPAPPAAKLSSKQTPCNGNPASCSQHIRQERRNAWQFS